MRAQQSSNAEAGTPVDRPQDVLAAAVLAVSRFAGQGDVEVRVSLGDYQAVEVRAAEGTTVAGYREALLRHWEKVTAPADAGVPARLLVEAVGDDAAGPSLVVTRGPDGGRTVVSAGPGDVPGWLVERLGSSVSHLRQLLTDPAWQHRAIADLPLQGRDAEREFVSLGRGAELSADLPAGIHAAFGAQARRTPDAVAVTDPDTDVRYRELDAWADEIGGRLRAAGAGRGGRVGVLLDRSAATIAALLAVLKSGAVYVPIDPHVPDERLAFMARDCGLALVVTEDTERVRRLGLPAVTARRLGNAPAAVPDTVLGGAEDPAYIIFTSGSTGRPKGVEVAHRSVLSLVAATAPSFGFGAGDVWTWFHSVAFDFSVWEIWGCLLTGGRLVVVPESVRRAPDEFRALLADQRVTVLNQTPSSFMQLVELECRARTELALRLVVFGGETLDTAALGRWLAVRPASECRLVNMYGITETTVHVTAQEITGELVATASRSVGPALPGWSVRVVDARQRPLPPGASGEIAVGGAGVALGYVDRAELTARRFVADPVSGERIYLSGDRGRMLPDGALEHLGRLDQQVKLRGYRVELGEIRAVLLARPEVLAAAVVVGRPVPEDRAFDRLDAYVVPAPDAGPWDAEEVRRGLAATLPDYMVPATLTPLPAMPLTANGKLDVAALPAPRPGRTETPADDTQALVLTCWDRATGRTAGLDDNFFDLGGNSLLATRLITTLRASGLPSARLADLYHHQTPRLLAAHYAQSS
ncbi:non-ribosomal peptide synthetase [Streptomyces murinus]|uniref:non-ribosomal peptide synthetase n=1 Tax=Streptomyces murinus TaxID=33900 RepID=UPI002E0ED682|nr:non-ribosomal peptide synthetase [Streptomyces murinus]